MARQTGADSEPLADGLANLELQRPSSAELDTDGWPPVEAVDVAAFLGYRELASIPATARHVLWCPLPVSIIQAVSTCSSSSATVDAAESSGGSGFHSPRAHLPLLTTVTSDIDGYRNALAGIELDMVRGGPDQRQSIARSVQSEFGVVVGAVDPGCKTICHAHLERDRISMSYVLDAAQGSRWCGDLDMAAGMSVIHQPDAEHTAINLPGTRFAFALLDVDALVERSEALEIPLQSWHPGDVDVIVSSAGAGVAAILAHIAFAAIESIPVRLLDDLLTAATISLSNLDVDQRVRATVIRQQPQGGGRLHRLCGSSRTGAIDRRDVPGLPHQRPTTTASVPRHVSDLAEEVLPTLGVGSSTRPPSCGRTR